MFRSTHESVTVIVPEKRYQALVADWFDSLGEGQIKRAITQIRWKEFRPPRESFSLNVTTAHPFQEEAEIFIRERDTGESEEKVEEALERLSCRYNQWIGSAEMPKESSLDGREAEVNWTPNELPYFDLDLLPPQKRARYELDRQAGKLLRLVEVTNYSLEELVGEMVGSNQPFFAAGCLISNRMRILRRFPPDFPNSAEDQDLLRDRVSEDPTDFVTLMRLAKHYGCSLSLVKQVSDSVKAFLQHNAPHLPGWLAEIDKMNEFNDTSPTLDPGMYSALDVACDVYRQALIATLEEHETELAEAINSFLPNFPIPEGPFAEELRDDSDWWRDASEN